MNTYVNPHLGFAVRAMEAKAREMGLVGVAAVLVLERHSNDPSWRPTLWSPLLSVVGAYARPATPATRGVDDTGTNYAAVAFAKIAEMVDTLCDSGDSGKPPKKGTFGWSGGVCVIKDSVYLFTAFSGGTGEQDVEVAHAGMKVLVDRLAFLEL